MYNVRMLINRDRDRNGEFVTIQIDAKDPIEIFEKINQDYDLQQGYFLNKEECEEYDENYVIPEIKELYKTQPEQAMKQLTDLLYEDYDISDYNDDIVWIEKDGQTIFESDYIDEDEWIEYSDDFEECDFE